MIPWAKRIRRSVRAHSFTNGTGRRRKRNFRRSLKLDPENVTARIQYSQYLIIVGRNAECLAEARRTCEADPLSPAVSWLSTALLWTGNNEEAVSVGYRALAVNRTFLPTYLTLLFGHYNTGDTAKALEFAERMATFVNLPLTLSIKCWLYAALGRREAALGILGQIQEMAKSMYVAPILLATIFAGLGDIEAWRKAMLAAYDDRSNGIALVRVLPQFKSLHSDPVFQEIVQRLAFP